MVEFFRLLIPRYLSSEIKLRRYLENQTESENSKVGRNRQQEFKRRSCRLIVERIGIL